jgi:hypothetical protein
MNDETSLRNTGRFASTGEARVRVSQDVDVLTALGTKGYKVEKAGESFEIKTLFGRLAVYNSGVLYVEYHSDDRCQFLDASRLANYLDENNVPFSETPPREQAVAELEILLNNLKKNFGMRKRE